MSITTKQGDGGCTSLPGAGNAAGTRCAAGRVSKDDPRIECLGALDELDAALALCEMRLDAGGMETIAALIGAIRHTLFSVVMPAAAGLSPAAGPDTDTLERWINEREKSNPIRGFIRRWTKPAAACLNMARTICRRAERNMTAAAI
ncbi:MAG: ATP:cob(I)alamin adenosyltransferase, partial [Treponema sp.]|nr:ATP:cob(I)alamin adenosyltransferase [Treponema sp.]